MNRMLLACLVLFAACPVTLRAEDTDPLVTGAAPPIAVEYVTAELGEDIIRLSLTGTIEAQDAVNAGFREGGRITEILIREGQSVRQGQPLARIDSTQQEQALHVADAGLTAAQARRLVARQTADRAEAMLDRGVGTRVARDAAIEELAAATTAVEQARTQVELSMRMLADTTLTAPFDGVITERLADPGQIVGPAQTVMHLARIDNLHAVFQAPDDPNLPRAMGVRLTLQPVDLPDVTMTARVTEIAPLIGPTTGSVELHAQIDSAGADAGWLGAPVRGSLTFPAGEELWLPASALVRQGEDPAVWVIGEDDRVTLRPITIRRYSTDGVCVSSGLEPGEIIVGAGSHLVYPGRKVRPAGQIGGNPTAQQKRAAP